MADMLDINATAGEKMAKGIGKVAAVNATAGRVTLDHEEIPAVGWPPMIMAFKADSALLKDVKAGDNAAFDLKVKDGAGAHRPGAQMTAGLERRGPLQSRLRRTPGLIGSHAVQGGRGRRLAPLPDLKSPPEADLRF